MMIEFAGFVAKAFVERERGFVDAESGEESGLFAVRDEAPEEKAQTGDADILAHLPEGEPDGGVGKVVPLEAAGWDVAKDAEETLFAPGENEVVVIAGRIAILPFEEIEAAGEDMSFQPMLIDEALDLGKVRFGGSGNEGHQVDFGVWRLGCDDELNGLGGLPRLRERPQKSFVALTLQVAAREKIEAGFVFGRG